MDELLHTSLSFGSLESKVREDALSLLQTHVESSGYEIKRNVPYMMEIVFFHAFCVHLERTEATAAKELRQELVSFLKRKVCQLA